MGGGSVGGGVVGGFVAGFVAGFVGGVVFLVVVVDAGRFAGDVVVRRAGLDVV